MMQKIYNYFYEFASEALQIVIFGNFVKSMTSRLSHLKVTPSFCFPFKIRDNPTTSSTYVHKKGLCTQKCICAAQFWLKFF